MGGMERKVRERGPEIKEKQNNIAISYYLYASCYFKNINLRNAKTRLTLNVLIYPAGAERH